MNAVQIAAALPAITHSNLTADRLINRNWLYAHACQRRPDLEIGPTGGTPHLRRWIVQRGPLGTMYLHFIQGAAPEHAHDHPWDSVTRVLFGWYEEDTWTATPAGPERQGIERRRHGDVIHRRAEEPHRIIATAPEGCWTLLETGPHRRAWGFLCPNGWRPWQAYVDPADPGRVGQGCGETDAPPGPRLAAREMGA